MKCFRALCFAMVASAELGYDTIRGALEWRAADGASVRHSGPLNPLLGFLLNGTGMIHNKRFFSPEIEPSYAVKEVDGRMTYKRSYNKDTAAKDDAFHKTLLSLFPSSAGRVSISMARDGSFYYEVCKEESAAKREGVERAGAIRLIAALAAMSLGTNIGWTRRMARKKQSITIRTSPPVVLSGTKLSEVACVIEFFATPEKDKEYLRSRMFLLQGFMFHFLNTKDDVETFFSHVYEHMKNTENASACFAEGGDTDAEDYKMSYTLLDNVVQMGKRFPFTVGRQPPSYVIVSSYSRHEQEGLSIPKFFTDCGEIALLNFMCCLLYSPESLRYAVGHLGEGGLKAFFTRHCEIFSCTAEIRREWLRVVEDLPDPEVLYVKRDLRNELEPGFVNMLVVLSSVCGLQEDFGTGLLQRREGQPGYGSIKDTFESAFRRAVTAVSGKELSFEFVDMRIENVVKDKWDVFGTVMISIPVGTDAAVKISLMHSGDDARVVVLSYPFAENEQKRADVLDCAERLRSSESRLELLVGRYARLFAVQGPDGNVPSSAARGILSVEEVFQDRIIDTDSVKVELLEALIPYKARDWDDAEETAAARMQIARNIVSSAALDDSEKGGKYVPFILANRGLADFACALRVWWKSCPDFRTQAYSTNLLRTFIENGRMQSTENMLDVYDTLEEPLAKLLIEGVKMSWTDKRAGGARQQYADYFFDRIRTEDLAIHEYSFGPATGLYLRERVSREDAAPSVLRKTYYFLLCSRNSVRAMNSALTDTERTSLFCAIAGSARRCGLEFVYDCIVRMCWEFYHYMLFFRCLLELAVRDGMYVRSDVLLLVMHLVQARGDGCQEPVKRMILLPRAKDGFEKDMEALIRTVERRGLVVSSADFDKKRYTEFIRKCLTRRECVKKHEFIAEAESIFGRMPASPLA